MGNDYEIDLAPISRGKTETVELVPPFLTFICFLLGLSWGSVLSMGPLVALV